MAATLTAPSAQVFEKQDVETNITFWKHLDTPTRVLDLRLSESEKEAIISANQRDHDDPHHLVIHDIRGEAHNYTLGKNGFQFVKHEVLELDNWSDTEEVQKVLVPATEELVKKITGASKTIILQTRIRNLKAEGQTGDLPDTFPAYGPHCDMTPSGAQNILAGLIQKHASLAPLASNHAIVINVWRPLKTITKDPLTLCDWQSIIPDTDIVPNRLIFENGFWHEFGKIAYNEKQKWCYLSKQEPDEPVLFMQYDSKVDDGVSLPHAAFKDERFEDGDARQSIEIKMFAFFNE